MTLNRKTHTLEGIPNVEGYVILPRWLTAAAYTEWLETNGTLPETPTVAAITKLQLSFIKESDIKWTDPETGEVVVFPFVGDIENPAEELPRLVLEDLAAEGNKLLMGLVRVKNSEGPSETTPSTPKKRKARKK